MQTAPELLDRAAGHLRDRAATYDKPEGERSMAQTVAIFNLFHGTNLTEAQGWHFMQVLKDVRLFTRPGYHADSAEDSISYCSLKAEAKSQEPASLDVDADAWDGWTPWIGGACPLGKVTVEVRFRNGEISMGFANGFIWSHSGDEDDIVSYCVPPAAA